jgi:hypothetical protein
MEDRDPISEVNETFFDTGILFGHFHCDRDLRCAQGHAFWNHPSGMRLIEGYYTLGIRSGRWREFAEDGSVLSVTELGEGEYTKPASAPLLAETAISPETTILPLVLVSRPSTACAARLVARRLFRGALVPESGAVARRSHRRLRLAPAVAPLVDQRALHLRPSSR